MCCILASAWHCWSFERFGPIGGTVPLPSHSAPASLMTEEPAPLRAFGRLVYVCLPALDWGWDSSSICFDCHTKGPCDGPWPTHSLLLLVRVNVITATQNEYRDKKRHAVMARTEECRETLLQAPPKPQRNHLRIHLKTERPLAVDSRLTVLGGSGARLNTLI